MCTFGVLGLSCASPGGPVWWGRRGFTRQLESPNVHISGFRPSKTPTKFHERTARERKKNENCGGTGKKKSEILGGPAEGCPAEGCPAEGGFTGGGVPAEGSIGNVVQGSGFRVQFRFSGTKTEQNKNKMKREMSKNKKKVKKSKNKAKEKKRKRERRNRANTICSTSANFDFGQFRLRSISTSANSISASWPKSNWPKSSIL